MLSSSNAAEESDRHGDNGRQRIAGFDKATSVRFLLQPLKAFLEDPDITEICVNRPGELSAKDNPYGNTTNPRPSTSPTAVLSPWQ